MIQRQTSCCMELSLETSSQGCSPAAHPAQASVSLSPPASRDLGGSQTSQAWDSRYHSSVLSSFCLVISDFSRTPPCLHTAHIRAVRTMALLLLGPMSPANLFLALRPDPDFLTSPVCTRLASGLPPGMGRGPSLQVPSFWVPLSRMYPPQGSEGGVLSLAAMFDSGGTSPPGP